MKYGSVCSGIEAATMAWEPLGWKPQWFSEIEPFPCRILEHYYPTIPNLGDMTQLNAKKDFMENNIELLVGGTPCQSFSLAGLREGLVDPRGNLSLTYILILRAKRPAWFVWENVPGVLSSNQGKDFRTFLNGVQELGYEYAFRTLDAQYFGVPQRRRRVFVVGTKREGCAAKVLFHSAVGERLPEPSPYPVDSEWPGTYVETPIRATLKAGYHKCYNDADNIDNIIVDNGKLRRLTPLECERIMGFPDNYTKLDKASDSARYRALGNSMVVPVMKWIGERINEVDKASIR